MNSRKEGMNMVRILNDGEQWKTISRICSKNLGKLIVKIYNNPGQNKQKTQNPIKNK
jgi:hypothetical protein